MNSSITFVALPSPAAGHSSDLTTTLVGKHQSVVRHLPGYTGHVPTLRHRFGETYGSATGELVTRPIMAKQDRKALNKVRVWDCCTRTRLRICLADPPP